MENRKNIFITSIIVAILSTILVFIGISNMWFGEAREGVMLFCERARDGLIKQPSNTFSNAGFIMLGIYVGWLAYKNAFSGKNKMTTTIFYPTFYASVLVFLGPGSMAMHATNGEWGGFTDLFSMFLFASFIFTYALMRWFRFSKSIFLLIYVITVLVCSCIFWSPYNDMGLLLSGSEFCFSFCLFVGIIFEMMNKYIRKNEINSFWGYLSIFTFGVSFFIWNISRTEDDWFCDPDSLIQGHAIWHLLCALAAFFIFKFYASENEKA